MSLALELHEVKIDEARSTESTCFTAELFLDGQCVGRVQGTGDGRPLSMNVDDEAVRARIKAYAKELAPPAEFDAQGRKELISLLTMNGPLSFVADELFKRYLESHKPAAVAALPRGTLDSSLLAAHAGWLRAGRKGLGRMELSGADLSEEKILACELNGAKLTSLRLTQAKLAYSKLDEAELSEVHARGANFTSATLNWATLNTCSFVGGDFTLAEFKEAKVDGCDFSGAELERSNWAEAQVTRTEFRQARFGNSRLDGARFTHCDFSGASFAKVQRFPDPSTTNCRFEDCDLRDTDWTDRNLSTTVFLRCKVSGAHGKPFLLEGLTVEDCDLDHAALLQQFAGS